MKKVISILIKDAPKGHSAPYTISILFADYDMEPTIITPFQDIGCLYSNIVEDIAQLLKKYKHLITP